MMAIFGSFQNDDEGDYENDGGYNVDHGYKKDTIVGCYKEEQR